MLQDGGLEFGMFFGLTIVNGMKLNHMERRRREEMGGLLSRGSSMAELTAKCLFHLLRSQLDRVTYCWPPPSPAITFDSVLVRHHEAKEKAGGVNQASVYSSVFCSGFFFLLCTVFFPSSPCRKSRSASEPGSTSSFRGQASQTEPRSGQSPTSGFRGQAS